MLAWHLKKPKKKQVDFYIYMKRMEKKISLLSTVKNVWVKITKRWGAGAEEKAVNIQNVGK